MGSNSIDLVGTCAVNELLDDVATAVELRHWFQLSVVQKTLCECPVHFLPHQTVLTVVYVGDIFTTRQLCSQQIPKRIPSVARRAAGVGLGQQRAIGVVGVAVATKRQQPVLIVVGPNHRGIHAHPVAVLRHGIEAAVLIIIVDPSVGHTVHGLGLLGDPAEVVAHVAHTVEVRRVIGHGVGLRLAEAVIGHRARNTAERAAGNQV